MSFFEEYTPSTASNDEATTSIFLSSTSPTPDDLSSASAASDEDYYCLATNKDLSSDSVFPIVFTLLIALNLIALLVVSVLIFLETRTKMKYHAVKEQPPKLVLTREYLEKLRPPKKAMPIDPNTLPSIPSQADVAAGEKTNLLGPEAGK